MRRYTTGAIPLYFGYRPRQHHANGGAAAQSCKEDGIGEADDPRRRIALRLTVLARLLRSDFDRHVKDARFTRSQWSLIAAAARHPGSTQRQIAERLDLSEVSAGRLIERLEGDGVLERRERPGDRRARAVFVTDAASPLLAKMSAAAYAREERWFQGLSDAELQQLNELLNAIYNNISPIPAELAPINAG